MRTAARMTVTFVVAAITLVVSQTAASAATAVEYGLIAAIIP